MKNVRTTSSTSTLMTATVTNTPEPKLQSESAKLATDNTKIDTENNKEKEIDTNKEAEKKIESVKDDHSISVGSGRGASKVWRHSAADCLACVRTRPPSSHELREAFFAGTYLTLYYNRIGYWLCYITLMQFTIHASQFLLSV